MAEKSEVLLKAQNAKQAAQILATVSTDAKNRALVAIADALVAKQSVILQENLKDLEEGKKNGLTSSLLDRLSLNEKRIAAIAQGVREIIALKDPVGEVISGWMRPNGLEIQKVRVPLGVIGIIYEARPNVTVDAAALCLKAGNAVVLRGGKEAIHSNIALTKIMQEAAEKAGLPKSCVEIIETTDRASAQEMMRLNGMIDVLIPRGGGGLIKTVVENSSVPVIETGTGNCHVYVDKDAELKMAEEIVFNAKVQRPSVCNAAETLLVHEDVADKFLPKILKRLKDAEVEIRGCARTRKIDATAKEATEDDWYAEFLDLILAVKIVKNIDEAISHIQKYSSRHTEAIVTKNVQSAQKFTHEIDSAAVFVNASTRFTDGFEFGLGAEIGISTQKLHARGPMGLEELTSTKFVVWGCGQVRT